MNTLISPARATALAFADGEQIVSGTLTQSDLAAAERRYIRPVVGAALHDRLAEGAYADFTEEYLAAAAALAARLATQPRLDIRTGPCGTAAPHSEHYRPAGEEALARLRQSLRTQLRALLRRATEYLEAHPADFPEYDPQENILNRCTTDGNLIQIH